MRSERTHRAHGKGLALPGGVAECLGVAIGNPEWNGTVPSRSASGAFGVGSDESNISSSSNATHVGAASRGVVPPHVAGRVWTDFFICHLTPWDPDLSFHSSMELPKPDPRSFSSHSVFPCKKGLLRKILLAGFPRVSPEKTSQSRFCRTWGQGH